MNAAVAPVESVEAYAARLQGAFSEALIDVAAARGEMTMTVPAASLRDVSLRLRDEFGYVMLVDVSGIDYIDSTGIGELVGTMQKLSEAGRRMALLKPQKRLTSLLELTGLDSYLPSFDELDEALRSTEKA